MDDNASFKVTIPIRGGCIPYIHTATTVLTIGGLTCWACQLVGNPLDDMLTVMKFAWKKRSESLKHIIRQGTNIIEATSILSISDNCVILFASTAKVVLLEVSALLVKAISSHRPRWV